MKSSDAPIFPRPLRVLERHPPPQWVLTLRYTYERWRNPRMLRLFCNLSEYRSKLLRRSEFGRSGTPCFLPSRRRGCGILFSSVQAAAASWSVVACTLCPPPSRRRRHPTSASSTSLFTSLFLVSPCNRQYREHCTHPQLSWLVLELFMVDS